MCLIDHKGTQRGILNKLTTESKLLLLAGNESALYFVDLEL